MAESLKWISTEIKPKTGNLLLLKLFFFIFSHPLYWGEWCLFLFFRHHLVNNSFWLSFTAGPGAKKAKDCVTIARDFDDKRSSLIEVETDEFPRLILFFKKEEFSHAVIVADNVRIDTQAYDVAYATVVLIAAYYAFNVEYPMIWQNFLGMLQHLVVQESYSKVSSSAGFANKLTEIEELMEKDGPVFNSLAKQI